MIKPFCNKKYGNLVISTIFYCLRHLWRHNLQNKDITVLNFCMQPHFTMIHHFRKFYFSSVSRTFKIDMRVINIHCKMFNFYFRWQWITNQSHTYAHTSSLSVRRRLLGIHPNTGHISIFRNLGATGMRSFIHGYTIINRAILVLLINKCIMVVYGAFAWITFFMIVICSRMLNCARIYFTSYCQCNSWWS